MNTQTHKDIFQLLSELGLITHAHREAALVHPRLDELESFPGPAQALVWLVARNIVMEEEFTAAAARGPAPELPAEQSRLRDEIVADTEESLQNIRLNFNREFLGELLTEGLIDQKQHDVAADRLPLDKTLASPAVVLAWMVIEELLSADELEALRARMAKEAAFPAAQNQVRIFNEAEQLLEQAVQAIQKELTSAAWRAVFPGGPLLWIGGFVLALAGTIWYALTPTSTPACDASETIKTVNGMLFMAQVQARSDAVRRGRDLPEGTPRLRDIREAGYAKADRVRGCLASLSVADTQIPYAYTIAPASARDGGGNEHQGDFIVVGADTRIVEARFGHIDSEGNYAGQAEPVGRKQVEEAFRAGVDAFNQRTTAGVPSRLLERMRARNTSDDRLGILAPERQREIAEVEPLGPCRELVSATRYACPLVVERNDPLLAALGGGGSTVLDAEFTFERDGAGNWQVTDEFPQEFTAAIVHARFAGIKPVKH